MKLPHLLLVVWTVSISSCATGFERGEEPKSVATEVGTGPIGFSESVYPIHQARCGPCHGTGGPGTGSGKYVLTGSAAADYEKIQALVSTASPGDSRILKKPRGEESHGGGVQMAQTTDDYKIVEEWISQGAPNN